MTMPDFTDPRAVKAWLDDTHVTFFCSADMSGESTWSVYREEYLAATDEEPIEGSEAYVSTHANEAEAEVEANRLYAAAHEWRTPFVEKS